VKSGSIRIGLAFGAIEGFAWAAVRPGESPELVGAGRSAGPTSLDSAAVEAWRPRALALLLSLSNQHRPATVAMLASVVDGCVRCAWSRASVGLAFEWVGAAPTICALELVSQREIDRLCGGPGRSTSTKLLAELHRRAGWDLLSCLPASATRRAIELLIDAASAAYSRSVQAPGGQPASVGGGPAELRSAEVEQGGPGKEVDPRGGGLT
jgi:hypothetical protein